MPRCLIFGFFTLGVTFFGMLSLEPALLADEDSTPDDSSLQAQSSDPDQQNNAPSQLVLTDEQVREAISQLADSQFSVRQKSLETLKSVNSDQLSFLTEAAANHPDNEVAKRCVELLERVYASGDRDSTLVRRASDTLESAAESERWFIAESARECLERNWKRRVEIAMLELQSLGANMRPRNPDKLWEQSVDSYQSDPTRDDHLKIFLDEFWKADARAIPYFRRLTPLLSRSFMNVRSKLSLVLIDGHKQTEEEIGEYKSIFGDINVSSRGRVYLGIVHQLPNVSEVGIRIDKIGRSSSASNAGLRVGDILLEFEGKPLKDFDELIELLKAYRVDDEVTFSVLRDDFVNSRTFDIKVRLFGWYDR